jgi:GNAT superfamily N-acetyltransferase
MLTDHPRPTDDCPAPSDTFRDGQGRRIRLAAGGEGPRDDERDALERMYDDFDPTQRAQGLPPLSSSGRSRWLDTVAGGRNVLAWHGEGVVGHAALLAGADGVSELVIFVHQDYQGAGVGSALLSALLVDYHEAGGGRVKLSVERSNEAAVALYRKFGFERADAAAMELEMSREV